MRSLELQYLWYMKSNLTSIGHTFLQFRLDLASHIPKLSYWSCWLTLYYILLYFYWVWNYIWYLKLNLTSIWHLFRMRIGRLDLASYFLKTSNWFYSYTVCSLTTLVSSKLFVVNKIEPNLKWTHAAMQNRLKIS